MSSSVDVKVHRPLQEEGKHFLQDVEIHHYLVSWVELGLPILNEDYKLLERFLVIVKYKGDKCLWRISFY